MHFGWIVERGENDGGTRIVDVTDDQRIAKGNSVAGGSEGTRVGRDGDDLLCVGPEASELCFVRTLFHDDRRLRVQVEDRVETS
jgi:hypothetical protein